jgi:hypothetical protein
MMRSTIWTMPFAWWLCSAHCPPRPTSPQSKELFLHHPAVHGCGSAKLIFSAGELATAPVCSASSNSKTLLFLVFLSRLRQQLPDGHACSGEDLCLHQGHLLSGSRAQPSHYLACAVPVSHQISQGWRALVNCFVFVDVVARVLTRTFPVGRGLQGHAHLPRLLRDIDRLCEFQAL